MSSQTRLWAAAGIIALIIFGGFALSVPHTRDLPSVSLNEAESLTPSVTLRNSYRKGVHTITGSLMVPDACTSISTSVALVGEEGSQQIVIAIDMPESEGVCLKEPKKASFTETIAAPQEVPLSATVNGSPASTTES